jgi:parallel beta-helix repeat protein
MKPSACFFPAFCLMMFAVQLEAGTYTVTSTADAEAGSFRQALLDAEAHAGSDQILFHIPKSDPQYNADNGVWAIRPKTSLPVIKEDGLEINGGSQAEFIGSDTNPYGPEIELDGSLIAEYSCGLEIEADGVSLFELTVNRFSQGTGIAMANASNGRISGCYIGTDPTGMKAAGNLFGIGLGPRCSNVRVIPAGEGKPNIVSGNAGGGIFISDSCRKNLIQSNHVGVNRSGLDTLGNGRRNRYGGIYIADQSDSNEVSDNRVGGNTWTGIAIWHSCGNKIEKNFVGTNADFSLNLSNNNVGVMIRSDSQNPEDTRGNTVRFNCIGWNGWYGVVIEGLKSTGNPISENHISKNGELGILWQTVAYSGTPVLVSAGAALVTGKAKAGSRVEVFSDPGYQGMVFLGSTIADASGQFSLVPIAVPPFPYFTATATDAEGNTSPFSDPLISVVADDGSASRPDGFSLKPNYPNPFNPVTCISYHTGKRAHVLLEVSDLFGRKTVTLADGIQEQGDHRVVFNAADLPSGVYVIRIKTPGFQASRKMALLR